MNLRHATVNLRHATVNFDHDLLNNKACLVIIFRTCFGEFKTVADELKIIMKSCRGELNLHNITITLSSEDK